MGGRARPWEASEAAANNASEGRELRAPRRARWARSAWGEQLATRASQTHFIYTSYTNTHFIYSRFFTIMFMSDSRVPAPGCPEPSGHTRINK